MIRLNSEYGINMLICDHCKSGFIRERGSSGNVFTGMKYICESCGTKLILSIRKHNGPTFVELKVDPLQ